jgi:hypothetical protein
MYSQSLLSICTSVFDSPTLSFKHFACSFLDLNVPWFTILIETIFKSGCYAVIRIFSELPLVLEQIVVNNGMLILESFPLIWICLLSCEMFTTIVVKIS